MDIYLVRHAVAEVRRPDLVDSDRRLTDDGRKRFERCVDGLAAMRIRLDQVLHSPWKRAKETAELLAPILDGSLVATATLCDEPSPNLLKELNGESVALVGHEPWMGETLSWLTTGDPMALAVDFKKGGVAWLSGPPQPGQMELRAMLPPRALRVMTRP